jgi:hypothetical protein
MLVNSTADINFPILLNQSEKQSVYVVMKQLILFFSIFTLFGCSAMDVQDYKNTSPELVLEDYFGGKTKASGVFQDRFGKVRRRFDVDITGTWDKENQTLKLVEDFVYDDGQTEQRIWKLTKTGDKTFEGYVDGVVGIANGELSGNAFNWHYTFDLPYQGKKLRVKFDDWMFLMPDGKTLFNKASIYKYGIRIGDVYLFFEKLD